MQETIRIVKTGGELYIARELEIKDGKLLRTSYEYGEDGEAYPIREWIPAEIEESFVVIAEGQFIRNPGDRSELNSFHASSGFGQTSHLMYSYCVTIVSIRDSGKLYESDCVYSVSGIRATNFAMYSYHLTKEGKHEYQEDRLGYEVMQSLDFEEILSKYLTTADIRNAKLNRLGI